MAFFVGEEFADLVDCRTGLLMPRVPSKAFWNGFDHLEGSITWQHQNIIMTIISPSY